MIGEPKATKFKNVQSTDTIHCNGNSGCNAGQSKQETFGVEVGGGLDIEFDKIFKAFSADISFTKQWTTGTSTECDGGDKDVVCEFARSEYKVVTLGHSDLSKSILLTSERGSVVHAIRLSRRMPLVMEANETKRSPGDLWMRIYADLFVSRTSLRRECYH